MLAVLGFVTILLVLALIMSKKVSTLVALIFVPAITGFIAAFINAPNVIIQAAQAAAEKAGTAYVEPVITFGTRFTKALSILSADYMGKGLSSIVATGVMFIFAILFFSTCSDAGVFDPIINRILKFTGEDPVKVCIGTFLIGCICHLDGSGATTFLIAIPACMPLFQKLKMNLWVEATIVALAAGIMNVMPWGGPTVRAAAAMSGLGYEVTGSELWVGIMPAWIAGLVTCLLVAAFLGKKEAKRIAAGIPAQEVTGLTEAKTTNTSNELARSGWRWYFNVALILVILYILVTNRLSPAVTFMIGYCVLLIVNYPSVDLQHKIINSHAQAAFLADTRDETLQQMQQRQKEALRRQWKQLARQAKTDLETFSRRHGKRAGALMDGLEPVTFEECDYTAFLRRFGAQNEVLQLSEDEFDLIYYTYGLRTYGNIPLVEPLEYRDDKRIREFVIAIDTSGSVQGDIVQSFLQRTCDVLRQSGSFTERVEIYLIQCDAEVQSVERLTSLDQLHELIPRLKLRGFGGTDFRPVFAYVDGLLEEKKLTNLNGLLYFTDGVGTYPEKSPAYKTAFIFNRDDHISPHVPSWAIRAVLTTDNIHLLEPQKTRTEEDTESWI